MEGGECGTTNCFDKVSFSSALFTFHKVDTHTCMNIDIAFCWLQQR